MVAFEGRLELLEELWEWAKENLTTVEIKKIFIVHRLWRSKSLSYLIMLY